MRTSGAISAITSVRRSKPRRKTCRGFKRPGSRICCTWLATTATGTAASCRASNNAAGNLVPAFRALQDAGILDILTCAATHAYLPLLSHDESIHLQLRTAVESYKRHFGRPPRGIWLPECAYRPAYFTDENRERPGLEALLEAHGLSYFFAETHMIEGGLPVGVAAGEVIGPYGAVRRRYVVPFSESRPPQPTTTFQPYYVTDPQVAVLGRENRAGLQVWSSQWGYPGEYDYREFHKKDGRSGLQYWRGTGARVELGGGEGTHPAWRGWKRGPPAEPPAPPADPTPPPNPPMAKQLGIVHGTQDAVPATLVMVFLQQTLH